jgi:hypothetical protein
MTTVDARRADARLFPKMNRWLALVCLLAMALLDGRRGIAQGATAHRRRPAPRCSSGRFIVQAEPLIAGAQTPAPDVIVLGARELAIGSGCPAAPRRLVQSRKRTTLHATWASCQGLKGKVRLTARVDDTCETMTGTLRARRFKRTFTATAARCGDGVIEAGEECEPPGSPGCDSSCQLTDSSVGALTGTIQLPSGLTVDPTTLSVGDLLGSEIPTVAGGFSLPTAGSLGTLAAVVGPTGAPLLLGWLDSQHSVISLRTTAETFAFAAIGATVVSSDAQTKVRLLLETLPEIQPLEDALAKSLAANPDLSAAATPDVLAALRAVVAAVEPQQAAVSRPTLWSRLTSWFVSPAVAMLLVNPNPGNAQSGITFLDTPDNMITTVPRNAFYLQNAYWRPAYAYVELVGTGIIPDAHSAVTRGPITPYEAFGEFPVAAVNPLLDTTGTLGQIVFGAVAGQPTAYVPVDSPTAPLKLPIRFPPATAPTNTVEATYAVIVVGPGGVNTNRSVSYGLNAGQLLKQFDIDTRYFVFDLMVPAALFSLDSRLLDMCLQAPPGSGLGSAVSQFIKQVMTDAPEVFTLSQQGLPGQALLKGVETLASNSALQAALANLLVNAYLDAATFKTGFGAIQKLNAEQFLGEVRSALTAVHLSDQFLNTINMSAAWVNYVTAHTAEAWTVTVRPTVVRLQPPSAALPNSQQQSFTVTIPELSGSGQFVGYKWTNTASVGHLTDGMSGHVDMFTSTSTGATYTANATGTGTDTVTVEAFEGDPNHGAPSIGTASATVMVGMTTTTTTTETTTTISTIPTTSTTLPPGGRQFSILPSTCASFLPPAGDCNVALSQIGQSCSDSYVVCICSAGGQCIQNETFYANPGDSIEIQCLGCNQRCGTVELVIYNGPDTIFPLQQVCLPSPPPANTVTVITDMSAPIPFPSNAPPQYCCQLPGGNHCVGGSKNGAACAKVGAGTSDCGGGNCQGSCFEYALGRPGDQNCAQMGGASLTTYCGGLGACGVD